MVCQHPRCFRSWILDSVPRLEMIEKLHLNPSHFSFAELWNTGEFPNGQLTSFSPTDPGTPWHDGLLSPYF